MTARCPAHDAPAANEAYFKCGCRWVRDGSSERRNGLDYVWLNDRARELGLHVVDAKQWAVLEAARVAEIEPACHRGEHCCARFKDGRYVCAAELARRESAL